MKKAIRYVIFSSILVFVIVAVWQIRIESFDEQIVKDMYAISEDRPCEFLTDEQAVKIQVHFENMKVKGYFSPKFESFYAEEENRVYVLVRSYDEKYRDKGVGYIIVEMDYSNSHAINVLTTSWVRIGSGIKNF